MAREYIIIAAGCVAVGIVMTFAVLGISVRLGIDLNESLWILAIPTVLTIILNISVIELYHRYRERKKGK